MCVPRWHFGNEAMAVSAREGRSGRESDRKVRVMRKKRSAGVAVLFTEVYFVKAEKGEKNCS